MKKIILIAMIVFHYHSLEAQKILSYVDYIDYYRENVKSTILTKQGDFLKDGKYKLKGNVRDFKFLLSYILKYDMKDFQPSDSLIYEGEIKDSLKVNVWRLTLLRKYKSLDLIYNKKEDIIIPGVNFNENSYGLVNQIINLKAYFERGIFDYANLESSAIDIIYNFGNIDYYIKKREYYIEKKNTFVSSIRINGKNNDKTYYAEYVEHMVNFSELKKVYYKKESSFECNDLASLDIKTEKMSLKTNKKINNYIYYNIVYSEIQKNRKLSSSNNKYVTIDVVEGLRDDKLIQLKFDYYGVDIKCPFTDLLKTNYYPIILYDVSRIE